MPLPAESEPPAKLEASPSDLGGDTASAKEVGVSLQLDSALPWSIFEAALDAMLITDDAGYYLAANPAACALLELPEADLVGRRVADFLLLGEEFETVWQDFLAAGQTRREQQLRLDNGTIKTVEFAATAHVQPNHHLSIWRDISDRKQFETERDALSRQLEQWVISSSEKLEITQAELRSQQQRIDSILNSLECVVWSVDPLTLETIYVNAASTDLYGHPPEAFLADADLWFNCIHPDDYPLLLADIEALSYQGKIDREYRIFRADGTMCWVRGQARLVRDTDGTPLRIDGTTLDISDRKRAEFALRDHQATQQALLEAIPDLMMRIDENGNILDLISGGEITLYGPIAPDRGQSLYVNFPEELADQRMHHVRVALSTGTRQRYEHTIEINGELRHEESRIVPISQNEVLVIVRDITERKRAEVTQADLNQKLKLVNAELNRLATVDGLTEIANRRSFDQALDLEWQRARRQQKYLSLILCDIDYFKPYNDNYGHLAGDDCLRKVAQMLSTVVKRPGDLVARYGGEEFVLLLPDTTLDGSIEIVEKVQAAIAQCPLPHDYSKVSSNLTLSFGLVCHCPAVKEHSPRELIHRADLALYEAKAQGRNRYVVGDSFT
ncbi:diguanylate cyclase [Nodosilinea sp. FACHB-131]|uniref:sensor domain-containing diguanylate cyclase n=1 Tax=Nodosilinea sp. FACHB-131 TaxID=2692832 RepID=UPI001685D589|nr:diguanylate cyclase [Nodosilinea sp. FACHB-131]